MRGYGPVTFGAGGININAQTENVSLPFRVVKGEVFYGFESASDIYSVSTVDSGTFIKVGIGPTILVGAPSESDGRTRIYRNTDGVYTEFTSLEISETATGLSVLNDDKFIACTTNIVRYYTYQFGLYIGGTIIDAPTQNRDISYASVDTFALASNQLYVYDWNGNGYDQLYVTQNIGSSNLTKVAISRDATKVASIHQNGISIYTREANQYNEIQTINVTGFNDLDFTDDGNRLIVVGGTSTGVIDIYNWTGTEFVKQPISISTESVNTCVSCYENDFMVGHFLSPFFTVYEYNNVYNSVQVPADLNSPVQDVSFRGAAGLATGNRLSAVQRISGTRFSKSPAESYESNIITYVARQNGTRINAYRIQST